MNGWQKVEKALNENCFKKSGGKTHLIYKWTHHQVPSSRGVGMEFIQLRCLFIILKVYMKYSAREVKKLQML